MSNDMAEVLLLAMDGDFLPGAGMGLTNAGEDIPFDRARPKEYAHWAASVLSPLLAEAWDEGHRFTGYEPGAGENPYRGLAGEVEAE